MAVVKSGKDPLKKSGNNPDGHGNLCDSKGRTLDLRIYSNILIKVEVEVRKKGRNCCYLSSRKRNTIEKYVNNEQHLPA